MVYLWNNQKNRKIRFLEKGEEKDKKRKEERR